MLLLRTKHTFDAAHYLPPPYVGKCSHMHGHTYHLDVEWRVMKQLDEVGLSVDFSLIKLMMKDYLAKYDHTILNNSCTSTPTAEAMVLQIAQELDQWVGERSLLIQPQSITLWETEECAASWWREPLDA